MSDTKKAKNDYWNMYLRKDSPTDKQILVELQRDLDEGLSKSAAMRRLMLQGTKYRQQQ